MQETEAERMLISLNRDHNYVDIQTWTWTNLTSCSRPGNISLLHGVKISMFNKDVFQVF